jgi:hypothetical protein
MKDYKIRLSSTDKRRHCEATDTLLYRITECGDGPKTRNWTTQKIAIILRTARNLSPDWLLRPQCAIWPPTRRRAVLWLLVHIVHFQLSPAYESMITTFISFIRKNKMDLYHMEKRRLSVANYLCVVDET